MSTKREDYISWDEYFMGVAKLSASRSKDPNTQVGCCIVSQDNKILSVRLLCPGWHLLRCHLRYLVSFHLPSV